MQATKYYIIFDTNILYITYDKKGDFSKFQFNATYQNIINVVNEFDIYESVSFLIPAVVWEEMKKQEIEAHDIKLEEVKRKIEKHKFPELIVAEVKIGKDYTSYIEEKIGEYKQEISNGINHVMELPLPTYQRFDSIMDRAFSKKPPFEGVKSQSDKGFKDALLWESILEFSEKNSKIDIIYYSKDDIFSEELEKEFCELFPTSNISICDNEEKVIAKLKEWKKQIHNDDAFMPDVNNDMEIEEYLYSEEFIDTLLVETPNLVMGNALAEIESIEVEEILDINENTQNKEELYYGVELLLIAKYRINASTLLNKVISINANLLYRNRGYFINGVTVNEDE